MKLSQIADAIFLLKAHQSVSSKINNNINQMIKLWY